MIRSKPGVFWSLRLIVALSLVAPALLFVYSTWETRQAMDAQANERIERALDVLQEHALKALQTIERSISETNEVLRGLPDAEIRAREADLFLRFKRTQQTLPQIESIWAFDRDGHPLVSSTILPVPRELNNSDRSYFRAQRDADGGTYVGEVVRARVGSLRFFVVSGRRQGEQPGRFDGVIGVTVAPGHFSEFYRKLTRGRDVFALVRADGTILARFPETGGGGVGQSPLPGALTEAIAQNPDSGMFTTVSPVDGVERRTGYRKVPGFPLYVGAGIETAALASDFWRTTLTRFAIGFPAVLAIFALAFYALRRAERFEAETVRREIAETGLKQAQRLEAIGQLTGGVAHDFNNLLMVVSGNAERLKLHVPVDDRSRKAFEAIEIAVKRGANLTRQLLSFSRRQTHEAMVIDLGERLPAVQAMLQSSLRGDITVEVEVADDLWKTRVDNSEFELALLNLGVNARDAMGAGGRLMISAGNISLTKPNVLDLEGDFVVVSVRDTGVGIAPENLGRVFEPFFTTKDVGKGTGLGLSQVYGFARQAGGTATVASDSGQGTTVTLYLPRSTDPVDVEAGAGTAPGVARQRERVHVLLVEDNREVAEVTRELLIGAGYIVESAPDVASALLALRTNREKFDIVLSDIVMPGGESGVDLARHIRQAYGDALPVVLATGYSDKAQTAAQEGFPVLRKPFDAATLHAALVDSLRKTR